MKMQYLKDVAEIVFYPDKCISCGICIDVCPHEVFAWQEPGKVIMQDKDHCMECGACALNCPTAAVEVKPGVG